MHILELLHIFSFGICTGIIIFAIVDNKNSLLKRLEITSIENYNLKKAIKSKNDFINALLDSFCEQGLIDQAEKTELQIKQIINRDGIKQ